jgi:hypothetical protein
MKHLLVKSATALLAAPLLIVMVQDAPTAVTASKAAPSAAVVAQARAHFIKVMSSHAPAVGNGGWVSPSTKLGSSVQSANGTATGVQSINWSGYADSETGTNTVSYASGSWVIPAVQCLPRPYENQDAFLADWVGLDGFTNGTVEQLGTATQCYEGVEYYYVWYEMFPAGTVEEGTTACINDNVDCPQPGDRVTASVSVTPAGGGNNNYVLTLTDHTRPQESFSTTQSCAAATCTDSSAEWIVERPAFALPFGFQILPLGLFGKSLFTSADVVSGGRFSSSGGFQDGTVYDISMIDDSLGYYLACDDQPAPPGSLLLTTQANACPTAAPFPFTGGFETSWDSSF